MPLASITLGHLMVLGQRLGIRWQEIRLRDSYLRGEGSGYTVASNSIRTFGLVVRLSVQSKQADPKSLIHTQLGLDLPNISVDGMLIPSGYVDKMLCGIVPGDPQLVGRDYYTVGSDSQERPELMFNAIQTHGDVQTYCQHSAETRMLVNDTLGCVCPWMPLSNFPIVRIQHPVAWQGGHMGYKVSLMHCWEAREILRLRLNRRYEELTREEKENHPYFKVAKDGYNTLATYADDFYCRWKTSNIHPQGRVKAAIESGLLDQQAIEGRIEEVITSRIRPQSIVNVAKRDRDIQARVDQAIKARMEPAIKSRMTMLEKIKGLFDEAQNFFINRNEAERVLASGLGGSTSVSPIKYLEFVRAYLSALAIKVARPDFKPSPENNHEAEIDEMILDKVHSGPGIAREVARMAHAMVDERLFVGNKLRDRDARVSGLDIEEAWWMLMLRGTCWHMSVWIEPPDSQALVPSSLYSDGSLVWII